MSGSRIGTSSATQCYHPPMKLYADKPRVLKVLLLRGYEYVI